MEQPGFSLTEFKQHLLKKISSPNSPDQDRAADKYLTSIYKQSLTEMLKFAIHLVKDNSISCLTRLGIVELIRNALMNKKNLEKIDESLQLRDFLLCTCNKVLSLPVNLKFGIFRMFSNVLNYLKVNNIKLTDIKGFEFCADLMLNIQEYLKEKKEDYLLVALWVSALEEPEFKEVLRPLLQGFRKEKDFEQFSDEIKFSFLNLEMQSVLWEDMNSDKKPAELLSSLLDILFKSLKEHFDKKNFEMALEHLILVWELYSSYPSDITQDANADKIILKKTCSKLLDFYERYAGEASWEVKKVILRILACFYNDDFSDGLSSFTARVLTVMLNNFAEQFDESSLDDSICFSGKINLNLAVVPEEYCIFHDNFERVGAYASDSLIHKLFHSYKSGFDDWRKKCALLIGIECFTVLSQKMIPYIKTPTIACLKDSKKKVRHCALRVVEEMAFYYEASLEEDVYAQLHELTASLLEDNSVKNQCLAASTLVTLSPKTKEKGLALFMKVSPIIFKFISKALERDASAYPLVPDMLACFSSMIPPLESEFKNFHKSTFEVLFRLQELATGNADLDNQIHGRIMETMSISLVNLKDTDAHLYKDRVIEFFLKNQGKVKNDLSPVDEYLITGWERLIEVFKGEIANYVGIVLNKLIPLSIKLIKEYEDRCLLMELLQRDTYLGKNHFEKTGSLRDPDMLKGLCGFYMTFSLRIPEEAAKLAEKISLFLFQTIDCLEVLARKREEEEANQKDLYTDRFEDIFQEVYSASEFVLKALEKSKHPEKNSILEKLGRKFVKRGWDLYPSKKNFQDEFIHLLDWMHALHKSMPKNIFSAEEISVQTNLLLEAWEQIQVVKGEDADEEDENQEEVVMDEDLRYSVCELAAVIINNNESNTQEMKITMVKHIVQKILEKHNNSIDDDNFFNNTLTHAMYLLVSIIEHSELQFIMNNMDWEYLVQQACKYASFRDNVLRQNVCFMLGLIMEKANGIPLNCTLPILSALISATKVTYPPESPFAQVGSFEECQDNLHAAIGKLIVSQHKFLPESLNPPPYSHLPALKDLVPLWLKGLPLKCDVLEGYDQHAMFFDFLNQKEDVVLGPEQGHSALLFECLARFLADKHKTMRREGLRKLQSFLQRLLGNLQAYPKIKEKFDSAAEAQKNEFIEFSKVDVETIKIEEEPLEDDEIN